MLSTSQGDNNAYNNQPWPSNKSSSNTKLNQRHDFMVAPRVYLVRRELKAENILAHVTGSRGNLTKSPLEDDDDFDYPPPPPKDVSYHRSSENVAGRCTSKSSFCLKLLIE